MQGSVIKFEFAQAVSLDDIFDLLRLARLSAEAVYNQSLVKIASDATVRADGRGLVIAAGSEVGLTVGLVFAELAAESLGHENVQLRLVRPTPAEPATVPA